MNKCTYCVEHHFAGLKRLVRDDARAQAIRNAIETGDPYAALLDPAQQAAMVYARKLTLSPADMVQADVQSLRDAGWDDGGILEINQVPAYFAYANRTVLGLGCSTQGDIIGLSPNNSANSDDWGHN